MRKINAPGIEFNEIDLSQYGNNAVNLNKTAVVVNGFTDKGTNYRTQYITSVQEFTNNFGYPTNEAERYLYNAVKEILTYGGLPVVTKLPYQNKALSSYTYSDYSLNQNTETPIASYSAVFNTAADTNPDKNLSNAFILNDLQDNLSQLIENTTTTNKYFEFINKIINPGTFDLILAVNTLFNTNNCFINTTALFNSPTKLISEISSIVKTNIKQQELIKSIKDSFIGIGITNDTECFDLYLKSLSKSDIIAIYNNLSSNTITKPLLIDSNKMIELSKIKGFDYYDLRNTSENLSSYIKIKFNNSGYITNDEYDKLVVGESSILNTNTFRIIDITKAKYERDTTNSNIDSSNEFLGLLPVLVTPATALIYQNIISCDNSTFKEYLNINSLNTIAKDNKSKALSVSTNVPFNVKITPENSDDASIEKLASQYFPLINFVANDTLDETYLKQIGLVLFKMVIDNSNFNKINFIPVESYVGSLDKTAKNYKTNASIFLDKLVNENSKYINFFSNFDFSNEKSVLKRTSTFIINKQPAVILGFYAIDYIKDIDIKTSISDALTLVFDKLKNHNLLNIDLIIDGGISNIAQYCSMYGTKYTPNNNTNLIINSASINIWRNIINIYDHFCKYDRRDCMFIADSPRNLTLTGNQKIVRPSNPTNTIQNSIVPSIKYLTDINTSYGAGYAPWFKIIDDTDGGFIWIPPSIKAITSYLISDNLYNFWDAPAGMRRGRMLDVYDISFNPNTSEAEQFYINRWNYAVSYPTDGIILEGQKTFQADKTAFDRVNIRRLFLRIEKTIKRYAKNFLYEPLTSTGLTTFREGISQYLTGIQQENGIIDFYIIADERNNNATTIDNNTLYCSIGIKPTKTLEFIVLDFVCTTQGANVEEITSQTI